jgi:hypothetical protein
MKLENQVCTYEQAVTLKAFGIKQHAAFFYVKTCSRLEHKNISLFCGIDAALRQYKSWMQHDAFLQSQTEEPVAAWNATELGVLLPSELVQPRNTIELYTYKKDNAFDSGCTRYFCSLHTADLLKQQFYTEAHARAAMLIYLLESGHVSADVLNQQLLIA